MRRTRRFGFASAILTAGVAALAVLVTQSVGYAAPAQATPAPRFSVRWVSDATDTNKVAAEVHGFNQSELAGLRAAGRDEAEWQRLFAAYAEQGDLITDVGLPPMLGAYRVQADVLRFEPRFSLEPGLTYRAVFRPDQLPGKHASDSGLVSAAHRPPSRPSEPTTVVSRVYPSAGVLPENLLKFYVCFSAPMSRGHIYEHIHLRDATGKDVELPFLEIDEELWDPTMTRLTLFIDPGRIKREVTPLEEIGPSLEAGKTYTLVIDRAWKDGAGQPLRESFQKTFSVAPPDRNPIDTAQWKIHAPAKPGTRDPLAVTFPKPMDYALAQRVIRVADDAGALRPGASAMTDQEQRWSFVPDTPWRRGSYRLVVQTTLEDLAGNNIGKSFEVDLFDGVQRRLTNATVKVAFEVR